MSTGERCNDVFAEDPTPVISGGLIDAHALRDEAEIVPVSLTTATIEPEETSSAAGAARTPSEEEEGGLRAYDCFCYLDLDHDADHPSEPPFDDTVSVVSACTADETATIIPHTRRSTPTPASSMGPTDVDAPLTPAQIAHARRLSPEARTVGSQRSIIPPAAAHTNPNHSENAAALLFSHQTNHTSAPVTQSHLPTCASPRSATAAMHFNAFMHGRAAVHECLCDACDGDFATHAAERFALSHYQCDTAHGCGGKTSAQLFPRTDEAAVARLDERGRRALCVMQAAGLVSARDVSGSGHFEWLMRV